MYSKDYRNYEHPFKKITTRDILDVYEVARKKFPNDVGVGRINYGKIEEILDKPFKSVYRSINIYDSIYKKAACYIEGIIRLHPFTDGNKRTAMLTAAAFLIRNKHYPVIPLDTVKFLVSVAKNDGQDEREINDLIDSIADWLEERTATTLDGYKKHAVKFLVPQFNTIKRFVRMGFSDHCLAWKLNDWFELEINPEYKMQMDKMLTFHADMTKSIIYRLIKDKHSK